MQKVSKVESSSNTLKEAKDRITKLMNERNNEEYDFDERLQRAKEEIWEKEQEAYEENAKRQQNVLSYVELYSIRHAINSINNNLSATTQ